MSTFRQLLESLEHQHDAEQQQLQCAIETQHAEEVAELRSGKAELTRKVDELAGQLGEMQTLQSEQAAMREATAAELAALRDATEAEKAKLRAQCAQATQVAQLKAQQLLSVARTNAKQIEANAAQRAKEIEREGQLKAAQEEAAARQKVETVQAELAKAQSVLAAEKAKQEAARGTLAAEAARQVKERHAIQQKQAAVENWDQASVSAASTHDTDHSWEPCAQPWSSPLMDQSQYMAPMSGAYQGGWDEASMGFGTEALYYGNEEQSHGGCVYYS